MIATRNSASERLRTANSNTSYRYSYVDLFMMLIECGCDVNAVNRAGQTALHIAVRTRQEILVLETSYFWK
ncbi:hypothetical protein X975_15795, partial [Stegodyphus mimosarum]